MGAGNSSQGKVYQGRAVEPSHKDGRGFRSVPASAPSDAKVKVPEVNIRTITWTRESHGLFDFEVKESERKLFEKKQFKLKGSHRIFRAESDVTAEVAVGRSFEWSEEKMSQDYKDLIIARLLQRNGAYWVFHKAYVDENIDQVLEKKPEEKIWRVVRDNRCPEMEMPCYRLQKKDLIKVGRVRFKIRDIMSPVYREIENGVDVRHEGHREMFPSILNASISSSVLQPDSADDVPGDVNPNGVDMNGDAAAIAEAHQNALLTESDQDEYEEPELQHANTILQGDVRGAGGEGMNAEEFHSDRDDANNTQFEPGKLIPKSTSLHKQSLDDGAKIVGSKKNLDNVENASQSEAPVCRICLMEESEVDNPLFAPCKCSGSMRYIHHGCLQTWFANKRIMKVSSIVTTYFWKNLECELCKTAYPYETRSLDGKKLLNIIEYDTPQPAPGQEAYYIVLESISSNTSKVIHVVNMKDTTQLYIGRGHDAHVRVTDISVSRLHATLIKSVQGYYFLTDNDSKFGTLSLVKTPLELPQGSSTTLQIGRSIFDIEVKNLSTFALNACLCFGSKPKKQVGQEDNLLSLDGNTSFPPDFATQAFLDQMDKRRERGRRRSSQKLKKSQSTSQGASLIQPKAKAQAGSPQLAAVLTENQGDESQLGQDDVRIHSGSRNNQFIVQPRGQQSRNHSNAASGHAAFDYGDEDDDGEEESDDYGGEHAIIMQRQQPREAPASQEAAVNPRDLAREEEEQLALAIQQSLAMQEQEENLRRNTTAQPNLASSVPEEEKEAQRAAAEASLDAEIEQLDKELSPNQPNMQAADGTASIEETKAGQIMNNKQGRVMTENASNISTQRASQVNKFNNQLTSSVGANGNDIEECKEVIDMVPHSPISAIDPMISQQNVDIAPQVDLSETHVGALQFMTAPGTELIKGGKGQDLRGKKTERVSDKLTNNVHGTINTEEFKFEDQEIGNTYRNLEEVKAGHINEENESDAENASKNNSIVVQNQQQSLNASNGNNAASRNNRAVAQEEPDMQAQRDLERNLPAQATEIQPPELGAGATDNMDTIQQREGGPAANQDEQDEFQSDAAVVDEEIKQE